MSGSLLGSSDTASALVATLGCVARCHAELAQ